MKTAKRHLACGIYILALLVGLVATPSAQAQTFKVLYKFAGGTDGGNPYAGLVRDAAGNLYGTTSAGGASNSGTVFKVTVAGKETVLYSFTGGADGSEPFAGLVRDPAGNLYGTAEVGGASGSGTVFKVDTTGAETVLHTFAGPPDGQRPLAGLFRTAGGTLYGTTSSGGVNNVGTVFEVGATGTEKVLHSFALGMNGYSPLYAGLVRDAAGNFYGTTEFGGDPVCSCGVVFKLSITGKETVLHTFTGGTDGRFPFAGLVIDSTGNLYGSTNTGGNTLCSPPVGCGTVFKVDTTGAETVLYSFAGGTDGEAPEAGLVMDPSGNLYGTTVSGGDVSCDTSFGGCGTVFKLDTAGTETVLHSFTGGMTGAFPQGAGLVMDAAGNLYGTTPNGGGSQLCLGGCGVVFVVKP